MWMTLAGATRRRSRCHCVALDELKWIGIYVRGARPQIHRASGSPLTSLSGSTVTGFQILFFCAAAAGDTGSHSPRRLAPRARRRSRRGGKGKGPAAPHSWMSNWPCEGLPKIPFKSGLRPQYGEPYRPGLTCGRSHGQTSTAAAAVPSQWPSAGLSGFASDPLLPDPGCRSQTRWAPSEAQFAAFAGLKCRSRSGRANWDARDQALPHWAFGTHREDRAKRCTSRSACNAGGGSSRADRTSLPTAGR